jgi:hypothetical protein
MKREYNKPEEKINWNMSEALCQDINKDVSMTSRLLTLHQYHTAVHIMYSRLSFLSAYIVEHLGQERMTEIETIIKKITDLEMKLKVEQTRPQTINCKMRQHKYNMQYCEDSQKLNSMFGKALKELGLLFSTEFIDDRPSIFKN